MTDNLTLSENDEQAIYEADGIIVLNKKGEIIASSEAACRITHFNEDELIGKSFKFLFETRIEDQDFISKILNEEKSYANINLLINIKNSTPLIVNASVTLLTQPTNKVIGIILVFRNMEEMVSILKELKTKNEELLYEKNKIEAIFNSRMEGTFTIDLERRISSFNHSAELITGYKKSEVIGKTCEKILKLPECGDDCTLLEKVKLNGSSSIVESFITNKSGTKVPIRLSVSPLLDINKNVIGAVETFLDISELKNLTSQVEERFRFKDIVGRSKSMQQIFDLMQNVIQSDSNLLITGESGCGKEIVARAIHVNSERKSKPFMAVNCSAFAETLLESELFGHEKGAFTGAIKTKPGRFELAGEGTLFLDEIGDLSITTQVKLLRVLETKQFERVGGTQTITLKARLITATNKKLHEEIKQGRFREDLFYRINVININIPPLRERLDDLIPLINHFVEIYKEKFNKNIKSISSGVLDIFRKYNWPGNIRELENVLEHAFVVCPGNTINIEHLPERIWSNSDDPEYYSFLSTDKQLQNAEKQVLITTLKLNEGNRNLTAEALGIDRTTLWRKMKKYGLIKKQK